MSILETHHQIEQAEEHLRRLKERLEQELVHQREQPPPDAERLTQGYPWPSSRITKADMIRLTELRRLTRKPITKLIHQAIQAYYNLLASGRNLKIVPYHGEGRSVWYIVDADASVDQQPCIVATAGSLDQAEEILRSLTTEGHERGRSEDELPRFVYQPENAGDPNCGTTASSIRSSAVYRSIESATREHPDCRILKMDYADVEEPVVLDADPGERQVVQEEHAE